MVHLFEVSLFKDWGWGWGMGEMILYIKYSQIFNISLILQRSCFNTFEIRMHVRINAVLQFNLQRVFFFLS